MANPEHLRIIKQGVVIWNNWRLSKLDNSFKPDLSEVDLSKANLTCANLTGVNFTGANLRKVCFNYANLSNANLSRANLSNASFISTTFSRTSFTGANLSDTTLDDRDFSKADLSETIFSEAILAGANFAEADLSGANLSRAYLSDAVLAEAILSNAILSEADLSGANFWKADLTNADLTNADLNDTYLIAANLAGANLAGANLAGANLAEANLAGANLAGANLSSAILVKTSLDKAILDGSNIYGISVWDISGEVNSQKDLIITEEGEPIITVDNIKVAQFIYLLLNNKAVRDIINEISTKGVLILGRFTPQDRKAVLNAIRDRLRRENFTPIVFDFEKLEQRDFTETIKVLAGMSRFVIVDLTQPQSSPLELQATIPDYMIPFVPIIKEGEKPFPMFRDLWIKHKWVLHPIHYPDISTLLDKFDVGIINRALALEKELLKDKERDIDTLDIRDL